MTDALRRGREAYERRAWKQAYESLTAADREQPLAPDDLERLAIVAYLIGRDTDNIALTERAHQACLAAGDVPRAARCAFWLGFRLMNMDDRAQAGGWLGRARRLLDEHGLDCAERGYLLLPLAIQQVMSGDFASAHATFGDALAIGERFHERDLVIMARHGQGRSLVALGRVAEGMALLDETMIAVLSGDASVVVLGTVYCSVLSVCAQTYDVRRAREWTAALTRWCVDQPDLVPYRGECLVRRAEVLQLQGAWTDAMDEARRAQDVLPRSSGQPIVGAAFYQLAEVHRLRGELDRADEAYRQAAQWWRKPLPGPALLLLARGDVTGAVAAIKRALAESSDPSVRAGCLGPCVAIALAVGDATAARSAADELAVIARRLDAPLLHAAATRAQGEVLLAADAGAALPMLRAAWTAWQDLDAPYEAARTSVLIGLACRQLGDHDAAATELGAARDAFRRLGAKPDAARVDALMKEEQRAAPGGLTAREVQVLRLIAAGKTNRDLAKELAISEKTAARHVSNIFTKLGLASRSAATAYAYDHGFVART